MISTTDDADERREIIFLEGIASSMPQFGEAIPHCGTGGCLPRVLYGVDADGRRQDLFLTIVIVQRFGTDQPAFG